LASLVKQIDAELQKNDALRGYVIVLTEDEDETSSKLEELWKSEGLKKLPLTTFGNMAGPKPFKLNKEADVTVHLWNKRKIKNSFAFKSSDLNDEKVKEVVTAVKTLNASEEKSKSETKASEGR
jgi:hypothetical protein